MQLRKILHVIATGLITIQQWEKRWDNLAKMFVSNNDAGRLGGEDSEGRRKCGPWAGAIPTFGRDTGAHQPTIPTELGLTLGNYNEAVHERLTNLGAKKRVESQQRILVGDILTAKELSGGNDSSLIFEDGNFLRLVVGGDFW